MTANSESKTESRIQEFSVFCEVKKSNKEFSIVFGQFKQQFCTDSILKIPCSKKYELQT